MHNTCTIDLSRLTCERDTALDCITDALASCGCSVFPEWTLFQDTLGNPGIIASLEADGNYVTARKLSEATEAQVDAVPGIGPVSVAELSVALSVYNLEFRV